MLPILFMHHYSVIHLMCLLFRDLFGTFVSEKNQRFLVRSQLHLNLHNSAFLEPKKSFFILFLSGFTMIGQGQNYVS